METVMSNEAVAVPNTVSAYADILIKLSGSKLWMEKLGKC
jgi:hypothetical protein